MKIKRIDHRSKCRLQLVSSMGSTRRLGTLLWVPDRFPKVWAYGTSNLHQLVHVVQYESQLIPIISRATWTSSSSSFIGRSLTWKWYRLRSETTEKEGRSLTRRSFNWQLSSSTLKTHSSCVLVGTVTVGGCLRHGGDPKNAVHGIITKVWPGKPFLWGSLYLLLH